MPWLSDSSVDSSDTSPVGSLICIISSSAALVAISASSLTCMFSLAIRAATTASLMICSFTLECLASASRRLDIMLVTRSALTPDAGAIRRRC